MNKESNTTKNVTNNIREIHLLGEEIRWEIKNIADEQITDLEEDHNKQCENIIIKANKNHMLIDNIKDAIEHSELEVVENLLKRIKN